MRATLLETESGKGYKLVVNGQWMYVSKEFFQRFVEGKQKTISFSSLPKPFEKR